MQKREPFEKNQIEFDGAGEKASSSPTNPHHIREQSFVCFQGREKDDSNQEGSGNIS